MSPKRVSPYLPLSLSSLPPSLATRSVEMEAVNGGDGGIRGPGRGSWGQQGQSLKCSPPALPGGFCEVTTLQGLLSCTSPLLTQASCRAVISLFK